MKIGKGEVNLKYEGDKVITLIVGILMLFSLVIVLSSTSLYKGVVIGKTDRLALFWDQVKAVGLGLGAILFVYYIIPLNWLKKMGPLALFISLTVSILLFQGKFTGWLVDSQDEPRALVIGMQLYVCEVLKVSLLYYLAWAVERYRKGETALINRMRKTHKDPGTLSYVLWHSGFFCRTLLFYAPIAFCCGCVIVGGTSSAIILGIVSFLTLFLGVEGKHLWKIIALMVVMAFFAVIIVLITPGDKLPGRLSTVKTRLEWAFQDKPDISKMHPTTTEYKDALKYYQQVDGCQIAIRNGGFFGRGTGNSQQKYVVPVIYADYVFSFICEEYGLFGAMCLIFLYLSLAARGRIIAKGLERDSFEQIVFAALVIMITVQAFMHIAINLNLGPTTGQTLPLISHGKGAFLCMSAALGIILSISRESRKAVQQQVQNAAPIIVHSVSSEAEETINDLNDLSNDNII